MLAEGAAVDEASAGGQTALMLAAVFGHEEVVQVLVLAGADTSLQDERGLTAHEWAIRRGFSNVAKLIANAPARRTSTPVSTPASTPVTAPDSPPATPPEEPAAVEQDTARSTEQHDNERAVDLQSSPSPPTSKKPSTPRMGGAAAAILRNHVARLAEARSDIPMPLQDELSGSAIFLGKEHGGTPEIPDPLVAGDQAAVQEPTGEIEQRPAPDFINRVRTADKQAASSPESHSIEPKEVDRKSTSVAPHASVFSTLDNANRITDDKDPDQTNPSRGPVFDDVTAASGPLAPVNADTTIEQERSTITRPKATAVAVDDSTSFPAKPVRPAVPPAFLTNQTLHTASGRPVVWLLVAVTLGGSAFAAYRLNDYFSRATTAPPASVQVAQPPPMPPAKTGPLIGGELAGAEIEVPDPDHSSAAAGDPATIIVRIQVNRRGKVVSARSGDGDPSLRAAAVEAARKTTFSPEKLPGKNRLIAGTITYNFQPEPIKAAAQTQPASNPLPAPAGSPHIATTPPTSADASTPVTGGLLAGTESNLPGAEYPASARRQRIEEVITITVRVNRAGKVISWKTGTGNATLRAAALKVAKRSTFSPDKLPGNGDVVGTITYNFKL